jgi:hypothetical protein
MLSPERQPFLLAPRSTAKFIGHRDKVIRRSNNLHTRERARERGDENADKGDLPLAL